MSLNASLLILGAGQYGQVAREVALAQGGYARVDFLDDSSPLAIGRLEELERFEHEAAFVAIGNPAVREQWVERIRNGQKFTLATLMHPRAVVMPSAQVEEGSIIEAGAIIGSNSRVGTSCIVMANAVVGHDASVGGFCQLKYHSTVPERCKVPPHTKLNCNTVFS